jgi:uncharacterized protein with beta-barrel porin domain
MSLLDELTMPLPSPVAATTGKAPASMPSTSTSTSASTSTSTSASSGADASAATMTTITLTPNTTVKVQAGEATPEDFDLDELLRLDAEVGLTSPVAQIAQIKQDPGCVQGQGSSSNNSSDAAPAVFQHPQPKQQVERKLYHKRDSFTFDSVRASLDSISASTHLWSRP